MLRRTSSFLHSVPYRHHPSEIRTGVPITPLEMKLVVALLLLAALTQGMMFAPAQEIDTIEVTATRERDVAALVLPFVILGGLLAGFVWQWRLRRASAQS